MTLLSDLLIFLITAGLMLTIIARLRPPLNLIIALATAVILIGVSAKLNGLLSGFTLSFILWLAVIIGGLWWYQRWLRNTKKPR